jgi:hypothetical protein
MTVTNLDCTTLTMGDTKVTTPVERIERYKDTAGCYLVQRETHVDCSWRLFKNLGTHSGTQVFYVTCISTLHTRILHTPHITVQAANHSTVANFGNIIVGCSSQCHSTLCNAHRQSPWSRLLCKSASLFLGRTWVLAPLERYERRFAVIPCISCVRHHPFDAF